jgi:hypothetical protein
MPNPSSSLATLRPDLASFFEYYTYQDKAGFVASQVLPVIDVAKPSGNFGRIPLEELLQERDTQRAAGSGYARGKFTFLPDTYATIEHGAEEPVDDNEAEAYGEYFDAEMVATARAFGAVMRNAEKRAADLLFDAATWTGGDLFLAITDEWNDAAAAIPVDDVEFAIQKVYDNSGMWANALIINQKVFRNLRNCDQIVDRINSAGAGNASKPGDISDAMLAAALGIERVIVAGATRNGANEGQAAAPSQIWSDEYAMIACIGSSVDMREPCVGRTFHWADDGSSIGGTVETYREEQTRSEIIRVRHQVQEKLLYTEAAFLLGNITG